MNTGGDLLIASGQDQTYQAARLESEGDIAGAVAVAAGAAAGSGAVSLANNRGDLGAAFSDTFSSHGLRGAAIAAVSAGVTKGVGNNVNTSTGATTGLDLSQAGDIARFAGQRATQAATDAGVRTADVGRSKLLTGLKLEINWPIAIPTRGLRRFLDADSLVAIIAHTIYP